MRYLLLFGLVVVGCQTAERAPVRPLVDEAAPMAFSDVLTRARALANQANEQFFLDQWGELEQSARSLEQAGRVLKRATGVPPMHQTAYVVRAEEIERDARQLAAAAQAKDVTGANAALRRLNAGVRSFGLV